MIVERRIAIPTMLCFILLAVCCMVHGVC